MEIVTSLANRWKTHTILIFNFSFNSLLSSTHLTPKGNFLNDGNKWDDERIKEGGVRELMNFHHQKKNITKLCVEEEKLIKMEGKEKIDVHFLVIFSQFFSLLFSLQQHKNKTKNKKRYWKKCTSGCTLCNKSRFCSLQF